MRVRTSVAQRLRGWVVGITLAVGANASWAHHSFAMFDKKSRVILNGTVTEFQWTNPHTYIELDVPQKNGSTKHYTIECSSISILRHVGWKPSDLKPGDKATVELYPLIDGRPGGLMDKVTLPDGRMLGNANDD